MTVDFILAGPDGAVEFNDASPEHHGGERAAWFRWKHDLLAPFRPVGGQSGKVLDVVPLAELPALVDVVAGQVAGAGRRVRL